MILEILAEFCASLGMKVSEAARMVRAPSGWSVPQPEIEVLVTDVRMPGLDGPGSWSGLLSSGPRSRSFL